MAGNNEDNNSMVLYGIDKITIGIPSKHLNYQKSPDELKGIIDVVRWGEWSELNIQLEFNGYSNINPICPLSSVLVALSYGIVHGLFIDETARALNYYITGVFNGLVSFHEFINRFFNKDFFKLDEFEVYFDFYGYFPFFDFNREKLKFFKNTIYTKDGRHKKRKDGRAKGEKRSLLAIYNRGFKIGCPVKYNRVEFRICDERIKVIMNPYDLLLPLYSFIEVHGQQIKHILKRYLPEDSLKIDKDYIYERMPILNKLIWLLD